MNCRWIPGLGFNSLVALLLLAVSSLQNAVAQTNGFPEIFDTEKSIKSLLSPEEATTKFTLPPGFKVTLFAGEPDVRQPIAVSTDDRGRLWVVENYTYADEGRFEKKLRDRIVIFEDADNDGHFDKRTVFWDEGHQVTSVAVGFGGIWVLAAPQLLFIPDRNGDDIPDGKPEVMLDGWSLEKVQHNIVNGLIWGPDGWLYGRQGILAMSSVGRPGASENERTKTTCAIWRFHPTRHVYEIVAQGTTNPWGMDFNDYGQGFFINTVIGHLWHVIPGAHYKRMFGQDLNAHSYELIDQHADHYHWDTGKKWVESRDGKGLNDTLGGGHAHSGLMIYLGDNWPEKYRDSMFTVNLHGYRLNNDVLERSGSGYVGRHGKDFAKTSDIWFRAVDLIAAPDGGVYVADWSDTGECHEADGVHRSSGRIYKITYGEPKKPTIKDVSKLSESELLKAVFDKNEWISRHARRVLQEQSAAGKNMKGTRAKLMKQFDQQSEITRKLRALWALDVVDGATDSWLTKQLSHENEHIRAGAIRLLSERNSSEALASRLASLAKNEKSSFVRLAIASALQRLPTNQRAKIASGLLSHEEDVTDHNLPLMIWYGIEALGDSNPMELVPLASESKIPLVRKLIARRLGEDLEKNPEAVNAIIISAAKTASENFQSDIVQGISEATKGWREAKAPKNWGDLRKATAKSSDEKLKDTVRDLSLVFGDEAVIGELRSVVLDETEKKEARRSALQKLIENKSPGLLSLLQTAVTNKVLAPIAARGLVAQDDPKAPATILGYYENLEANDRPDVISALVSRPAYASALLDAVSTGKIKRSDISAYHARQIASLNDAELKTRLTKVWGEIRSASKDKEQLVQKYKGVLTTERLKKSDPSKGRELFAMSCALCHKLYGEGASIGPDLTGSGRSNLDYLLENILDPSAIVGADFKMAVVTLKDGRVLNGIITAQTDRTITLQSFTESTTLERKEIEELKNSETSLMPEGLLESLDETQVADLVTYLMSAKQVPLPATAPTPSK